MGPDEPTEAGASWWVLVGIAAVVVFWYVAVDAGRPRVGKKTPGPAVREAASPHPHRGASRE